MCLIWAISSDVFCLQTSIRDLKSYKGPTFYMSVELTSTEPRLKSRLYNKKRRLKKSAIIITRSTLKSINGSISASTTSEGLLPNGTPRSLSKYSWILKRQIELHRSKWPSATAKIAICFLLIDLCSALVPIVNMRMLGAINVINARSSSTRPRKWRTIAAIFAKKPPF